ncbi:MAG: hypothetical protein JWN70_7033, partial [Planctomycetaceae bacterium]|nr:hypothetical protein [Planctomycetaceae bacterium]
MLVGSVNMADMVRGGGPQVTRLEKGGQRSLKLQQKLMNEVLAKRTGGSKPKCEPLGLAGQTTPVAPAKPVVAPKPVADAKTLVAAQPGQDVRDVRAEVESDRQRSGPRLDRRDELIKLAQPLLDQGVPIPEVHAALEKFVQRKQWGYLSPATRDDIVESAFDALVDAEMAEE